MSDIYIIRNQNNHYLGKSKEWVDGSEPNKVYKTAYKDEAINSLVEAGSKDFELRGEILEAKLSEKGFPLVEVLNPIPKEEKQQGTEGETAEAEFDSEQSINSSENSESSETLKSAENETQAEAANDEPSSEEDESEDSLSA